MSALEISAGHKTENSDNFSVIDLILKRLKRPYFRDKKISEFQNCESCNQNS